MKRTTRKIARKVAKARRARKVVKVSRRVVVTPKRKGKKPTFVLTSKNVRIVKTKAGFRIQGYDTLTVHRRKG